MLWDDQTRQAIAVGSVVQLVGAPEAVAVTEITGDSLRVGQQGSEFTS